MSKEYQPRIQIISTPGVNILPDIFDGFENASIVPWSSGGEGTPTVAVSTTLVHSGSQSLKMQTRATTPAANDTATASRTVALREAKFVKCGFMYQYNDSPDTDINLRILVTSKANNNDYRLNLDKSANDFGIYVVGGTYQSINSVLNAGAAGWYPVEIMLDIVSNKYNKLTIGGNSHDITAYQPPTQANQGDKTYISITLKITTINAERSADIYFDNFYLIYE